MFFHHGPYFFHTQQSDKCEILEQQKLHLQIAGAQALFTRSMKNFIRQEYFCLLFVCLFGYIKETKNYCQLRMLLQKHYYQLRMLLQNN